MGVAELVLHLLLHAIYASSQHIERSGISWEGFQKRPAPVPYPEQYHSPKPVPSLPSQKPLLLSMPEKQEGAETREYR